MMLLNTLNGVAGGIAPAPDLDPLFAPRPSGYLGADAALSIPLPDGRVLWIFGDTLVGCLGDGGRQIEAMPRNSVAVQRPGTPGADKVDWVFTDGHGHPSTFFRLPSSEEEKWFWPGTGFCLGNQLFLFGYGVKPAEGECEALSFQVCEGWLARIRDTSGSPLNWRVELERLPYPAGGGWFCSACHVDPSHVYLLGLAGSFRKPPRSTWAVLARVRIDALLAHRGICPFEFWVDQGGIPGWSTQPDCLIPLYKPGVTECGVVYDAPRRRYLATTYVGRSPEFYLVKAPSLTGPWSEPVLAFHAEDHVPPEKYLSYTFRLHPHLASGPDDLVATYVVNPRSLADLVREPGVYYPRFLRIDLTRV